SQAGLPGAIDDPHPAASQLPKNLVSGGLRPFLGGRRRAVGVGGGRVVKGHAGEALASRGAGQRLLQPAEQGRAGRRRGWRRGIAVRRARGVARETLQRPLAVSAPLDVRLDGAPLGFRELLGQQTFELLLGEARGHDVSSTPSGSGGSSLRISSWIIFCTLLRATNTVATFMPSFRAASAPDSPPTASKRNASHVCGCTRSRTRADASSSNSRSNSASSCFSRSSRARALSSNPRTCESPVPAPAR